MTNTEIRDELAALREFMQAGFARSDRYFELLHAEHLEWRDELRLEIREIRDRLDALTVRVERLENEVKLLRADLNTLRADFNSFRDWTTREFADVRSELRDLKETATTQTGEIQQLSVRVDRLEQHWNGTGAA
jgi:uncharacterized coiled-coil DUF342 family protein